MKHLTFVVTAFLTLVLSTANAHTCADLFGSSSQPSPLSPQLLEAIREMESGEYKMAIEKIEVDGRERIVVLTGEGHVKSKLDARRFAKLLPFFKAKGVEGYRSQNYFLGKYMGAIDYSPTELETRGSSIDMTFAEGRARGIENQIAQHVAAKIKAGKADLSRFIERWNQDRYEHVLLRKVFPNATGDRQDAYNVLDQLSLDRIVDKIRNYQSGAGESPEADFKSTVYALEAEYRPSLREHFGSGLRAVSNMSRQPICLGALCGMGALAAIDQNYHALWNSSWMLLYASLLGSKAIDYFGLEQIAVAKGRDSEMTRAILKAFKAKPETEKILVVVGQAHVPGMIEDLRAQGSSEVPFR